MTARQLALRGGQVLVSIGLTAYLVSTIPMRDVFAALHDARTEWLVAGLALAAATNLLGALQMRTVLAAQGMAFSLGQVAGINLITSFYAIFLPGIVAGGVIRWHHFSSPEGKRAQALAAMIFSRAVEITTMLGYGIVFWYLANSTASSTATIATMLVALIAIVSVVLLSVSRTPHAMFHAAIARAPISGQVRGSLHRISNSLLDFGRGDRRIPLRIVLLCVVRNAFAVVVFICFARAVNIAVPVTDLGWIRAVVDLVLILPISIAGIGVRDASMVAMLGSLGVPSAVALAHSLLLLAVALFLALLGGLLEGWRLYRGIKPGLARSPLQRGRKGP